MGLCPGESGVEPGPGQPSWKEGPRWGQGSPQGLWGWGRGILGLVLCAANTAPLPRTPGGTGVGRTSSWQPQEPHQWVMPGLQFPE